MVQNDKISSSCATMCVLCVDSCETQSEWLVTNKYMKQQKEKMHRKWDYWQMAVKDFVFNCDLYFYTKTVIAKTKIYFKLNMSRRNYHTV